MKPTSTSTYNSNPRWRQLVFIPKLHLKLWFVDVFSISLNPFSLRHKASRCITCLCCLYLTYWKVAPVCERWIDLPEKNMDCAVMKLQTFLFLPKQFMGVEGFKVRLSMSMWVPDDPGERVDSPGEGFMSVEPSWCCWLAEMQRERRYPRLLEPASSSWQQKSEFRNVSTSVCRCREFATTTELYYNGSWWLFQQR